MHTSYDYDITFIGYMNLRWCKDPAASFCKALLHTAICRYTDIMSVVFRAPVPVSTAFAL